MTSPTPEPSGAPTGPPNPAQYGIGDPMNPVDQTSASPTDGSTNYYQNALAASTASNYKAWWGFANSGSNVRQPDAGSFRNAVSFQPGDSSGGSLTYSQEDMTSWLTSAWQDPSMRTLLTQYAIANGYRPDFPNVQTMWLKAGEVSSYLYQSKNAQQYMTPMQVLSLWAGTQMPTGRRVVSSASSSNRSVSYDISDPQTAKALTNAVLQAALGRQATDAELVSYKKAINAYEQAHPAISTSDTSSTSSYDTQTGATRTRYATTSGSHTSGATSQGRQQVVQDIAQNSAEGQAYMTQDVFEKALQVLAGRIG